MILFICNCHGEIKIPKDLSVWEDVVIREHSYLCSAEGKGEIKRVLKEGDRLIIAGCTPRVAEKFFSEFEPEIVNIREQVAWLGHNEDKIRDLIRGAIEKVKVSKVLPKKSIKIQNKNTLVVGAGVAGLEVARQIAESGFKVHLIEKEPFIGGMLAKLDRLYPEGTPNSHTLYPLINDIVKRRNIKIYTSTELEKVTGGIGNYTVKLRTKGRGVIDCLFCGGKCEAICPVTVEDHGINRKAIYYVSTHPDSYAVDFEYCNRCGKCVDICPGKINLEPQTEAFELQVGTIIVATGLSLFDATKIKEYGYWKYENVLTALEFERKIASGEIKPDRVVIVNCAGSRDERYLPYCSRVCCLIGLKEAKLVKDRFPDTDVYLIYMDMRSYGQMENFYRTLRDTCGVTFVNGRPSEVFQRGDRLIVKVEDTVLGELIEIDADYVVLSTGFVPDESLFKVLGIPVTGEFPEEYVSASLSVDSNPRGIYIAGSAAYPRNVKETLINAREVSSSVINLLSKDQVEMKTPVPKINSDICSALNCKVCVAVCPYGAVKEIDNEIKVDESMCMGCGICTATCGAGANQLENYTDREILAQIRGTIGENTIACFLCRWSAYQAADKAGYERLKYSERVRIMRIPCMGRVDTQLVLEAFNSGASGVLVAGCYPDSCHYRSGNFKARRRFLLSRDILEQFGVDSKRLRIEWIGKDESKKLVSILNEMTTNIETG
ncbi:MAG TPA: hydrogenase iron-sulfur subunit [bacterium (Candidatus Stahlbacteria)]|nr:hydrogenase iron-sulfur subunit [Candidatus Stahlbacteria bacterium]